MEPSLPHPLNERYRLRYRQPKDRRLIRQWMHLAYQAQGSEPSGGNGTETLDEWWSDQSQAWILESIQPETLPDPCGCLWLGFAIHQSSGDRYPHIFLLYVSPAHRRQGLGMALMNWAEQWAIAQGYGQIGLQVFVDNLAAWALYQKLGYVPQAIFCSKSLPPQPTS